MEGEKQGQQQGLVSERERRQSRQQEIDRIVRDYGFLKPVVAGTFLGIENWMKGRDVSHLSFEEFERELPKQLKRLLSGFKGDKSGFLGSVFGSIQRGYKSYELPEETRIYSKVGGKVNPEILAALGGSDGDPRDSLREIGESQRGEEAEELDFNIADVFLDLSFVEEFFTDIRDIEMWRGVIGGLEKVKDTIGKLDSRVKALLSTDLSLEQLRQLEENLRVVHEVVVNKLGELGISNRVISETIQHPLHQLGNEVSKKIEGLTISPRQVGVIDPNRIKLGQL